jgi:general secretion pathway protein F/type IV pilus assembly protein PilC
MALFEYKAIGIHGKLEKGIIDSDSLAMAKEKLRKQQIFVTEILALKKTQKKSSLSSSQLLHFTRELSQLLKAGLPLYESLVTIEEKQKNSKNHALFVDLCDRLRNGYCFSAALALYPETFNDIYLSMISSAEQSSSLSESFEQLTDLITKQQKLKKQITSSLAYPAFLGGFCFFVIIALFCFVIPSMKELLEGRTLHPLTQAVLGISSFLESYGSFLFLGLLATAGAFYPLYKFSSLKEKISKTLLQLPFCKKIIIESSLVRFFRTMSMLLAGGVPLVEAIKYSKKSVGSSIIENLLSQTEREIIEGKKMSSLFAKTYFIPPLVIRMLTIGEETGNMGGMMRNLAQIYEEELDKHLSHLVTFLQPAVLLLLGGIVGLVVLSILLPLTDVSSFVSS